MKFANFKNLEDKTKWKFHNYTIFLKYEEFSNSEIGAAFIDGKFFPYKIFEQDKPYEFDI